MVNLYWLKTFVTLVEQGHFTRTADLLAMTQPGVSQHIKKLEDYYETPLINRHGKSFELTPSGETVFRFARNLLENEQHVKEKLGRDDTFSGLCRLSSPGALGLKIYPQLVQIQKEYPDLNILFEIAPNHRIESELLNNHIDCGFMTQQPKSKSLSAQAVAKEKLCLAVPEHFSGESYQDLKALGMINHPDATHHTSLLFQANFSNEFKDISDLPVKGYINQINLILEPVAAGLGFTVLPESVIQSFPRPNSVRVLELTSAAEETIYRVSNTHKLLPSRFGFLQERLFKSCP